MLQIMQVLSKNYIKSYFIYKHFLQFYSSQSKMKDDFF